MSAINLCCDSFVSLSPLGRVSPTSCPSCGSVLMVKDGEWQNAAETHAAHWAGVSDIARLRARIEECEQALALRNARLISALGDANRLGMRLATAEVQRDQAESFIQSEGMMRAFVNSLAREGALVAVIRLKPQVPA